MDATCVFLLSLLLWEKGDHTVVDEAFAFSFGRRGTTKWWMRLINYIKILF